ncbi:AZI2 [Branchiostoma lanceolatum]|uniref:AZI2 protein n=1 Tax=Branchiostoma lanceolatum TaxID=7740 RepID=A0A8J9VML6_BRALA|nr:AZI2 [Branchiostoma lanceolatum]
MSMMGTVAGDDDISILEATAGARMESDTQPLLQDQSTCHNGEEEGDVLQNASYFALKKAFAALKVRLREVEHENEQLHRQVKQLESSSGDFSGSGAPRPELMPSINKAYEAYKEKCHESSQLKEQLSKVTQNWKTAEGQLQQLREQLSRGCTKCAVQQTAGSCAGAAEGQTAKCNAQGTAQSCSKCDPQETAESCTKCAVWGVEQSSPDRLEVLRQNQMEKFSKPTDPVPPLRDLGGSAPASLASVLQEEMDQTRAEMVQLRSLVRTQRQTLNRLLSTQTALSPEPASGARESLSTPGDSDIGSLGVLEGAELPSYPHHHSADPMVRGHDTMVRGHDPMVGGHDPMVRGHDPMVRGHDPMVGGHDPVVRGHDLVGGHGIHPVQCTDEFSRQNKQTNRNGESEDLMLFSASTLASRQTNQFGRTLNSAAANTGVIARPQYPNPVAVNMGSMARPRYPPADGYHCIVGIPLPTGRPERPREPATLENRFRQLGANQSVQTPIQYERNTEYVPGRHDNVGSNVNITQPEPTINNQSPTPATQPRQFAWLESGKDIPPQNIYTTPSSSEPSQNSNSHDLPPQVRGQGEVGGRSGEWGGEVVGQGSALEWDRECPMCQQVFPDDIPQEMFVQHVNAHFEEEEARDDGFELFQM